MERVMGKVINGEWAWGVVEGVMVFQPGNA